MPFEQLLALAILALVGSFTPGPNNMIATVTGANHGFRAALPHIFGVPFGFASLLIVGTVGVAALLLTYPFIAALIKWAGITYLLFIAWQLARPNLTGQGSGGTTMKPLSFWQSAAFQCQSEGMDARCGDRRIVHDEPCDIHQHCHHCHRILDCCNRQPYHLGVACRRRATLAQRRLANANF